MLFPLDVDVYLPSYVQKQWPSLIRMRDTWRAFRSNKRSFKHFSRCIPGFSIPFQDGESFARLTRTLLMMAKIKGLKPSMFYFHHPHQTGLFFWLRKGHRTTPIRQIMRLWIDTFFQKLHHLRSSSFWHFHGSLTLVHLDRYHEVKPNGI